MREEHAFKPAVDCPTGKRQHTTKQQALKHVLKVTVRDERVLIPYECQQCGYWHVGHRKR